jgi:hypothetical protein
MNDKPVKVIFRRWRKKPRTVIAIFPEILFGSTVQMYEHVGQHGDGDYQTVIGKTFPVQDDESDVIRLREELEKIGYKLRVIRRRPVKR